MVKFSKSYSYIDHIKMIIRRSAEKPLREIDISSYKKMGSKLVCPNLNSMFCFKRSEFHETYLSSTKTFEIKRSKKQ